MKTFSLYVLGLFLSLFGLSAQAAIDVTAATGGITDAQVAILSVIGGLMTLATTLFGIMMVYRFVSKKSGVS